MFSNLMAMLHVLGALAALASGMAVFVLPKGSTRHRRVGYVYFTLMIVLNLAALLLRREAFFGPFHVLAVVSLCTILVGVGIMVRGAGSARTVAMHAYFMASSYAGLVAAAVGQVMVQVDMAERVPWAILGTLLAGGVLIGFLVPRTLGRVRPAGVAQYQQ